MCHLSVNKDFIQNPSAFQTSAEAAATHFLNFIVMTYVVCRSYREKTRLLRKAKVTPP